MEFIGDEKRIRAQFSDLAIRDQSFAPEFEKLWTRAESTNSEPRRRSFGMPFVVFASLGLFIAVTVVAVWLRGGSTPTASQAEATERSETASSPTDVGKDDKKQRIATSPVRSHRASKRLFFANRRVGRPIVVKELNQKVVAISNWKSPTDVFLQSPVPPVFKSLPSLNQSVKELESYLSSNELKESKQ